MEKRHINRKRHLAAAVAAMALGGLAYNADASLQFSLVVDPASNGFVNSGNANITGTSPITLDVIATVTGTSASSFQGIQSADLNFTASGGSIAGALTGATAAPFGGNASSGGTSSGLFLGSTDTTNATGWFVAHADNMTSTPSGSPPQAPIKTGSTTESFTLGTVVFTPTSGSGSGTVQLGYRQAADGALWFENAGTAAGTGSTPNVVLSPGSDRELTGPGFTNATIGAAVNLNAVVTGVHDHWKQGVNAGNWGATGSWDDGVIPLVTEGVTFGTTPGATGAAAVNLEAPHTATGITFNSTAGNNYTLSGSTLTLDNGAGTAAVAVTAGTQVISAPVTLNSNTTVAASVGTSLTMSSLNATAKNFSSTGAGSVTVDKLRVGALSVTGGGTVAVIKSPNTGAPGNTSGTSVVTSATVSGTGSKLDLGDHKMIVTGGGASVATYNAMVKTGAASPGPGQAPVWTGDGIMTSAPLVDGTGHVKALGVAANSVNSPTLSSFGGQPVTGADLLMGYTYAGDANMDGSVNFSDFLLLQNNFNGSSKLWEDGDFNYDGVVNFSDFLILQNNFNQTAATGAVVDGLTPAEQNAAFASFVSAVPEPGSLMLMGLGAVGFMRRRRNR